MAIDNLKMSDPTSDCFICRKHRGEIEMPGSVIYEDVLVFARHGFKPGGEPAHYLGHLLVEPKRHVAGIGDLTDEEASHLGVVLTRLGRVLRTAVAAEHIYLFVMGHHVDHLHYHLFPRYPGTPRQYWGIRLDEWPDAPRGDPAAITALCAKLKAAAISFNL